MNQRLHISGYVLVAALLFPAAAVAQGARLKLDQLSRLADKADDTVDINVDTTMLKLATSFLVNKSADAAKLQQLIEDITGIYVKSFEFKGPGGYTDADVESVRKQVTNAQWSRIVSVRERDELTEIYFFKGKDDDGGVVLISAEAHRADDRQHRRPGGSGDAGHARTHHSEAAGRDRQGPAETMIT